MGASSGIGREFALALGADARKLVLVARREDRLRELAEQLTRRHRVPVDVVTADLTTADGLAAVVHRLGAEDVDVLVNNAGFATHGRFTDEDPARIGDEVALNVRLTWQVHLTPTAALTPLAGPLIARVFRPLFDGFAAGLARYAAAPPPR